MSSDVQFICIKETTRYGFRFENVRRRIKDNEQNLSKIYFLDGVSDKFYVFKEIYKIALTYYKVLVKNL